MDLHGGFFDEAVGLTAPSREIWAAGLGARLGFLVTPQILTYVNGGYTPTRYDNVNFPGTTVSLPGQTFNGGFNGGGTEVAVAACRDCTGATNIDCRLTGLLICSSPALGNGKRADDHDLAGL
jgi:hypothetical protein